MTPRSLDQLVEVTEVARGAQIHDYSPAGSQPPRSFCHEPCERPITGVGVTPRQGVARLEPSERGIEDDDVEVTLDPLKQVTVHERNRIAWAIALGVRACACDRFGIDVDGDHVAAGACCRRV